MTEREKAAAGLLYDANYDKELIREREACKDLCKQLPSLRHQKSEGDSEKTDSGNSGQCRHHRSFLV